ncbi:MAG: hypothetical protein ABSG63_08480 [Spirochaetia bacterium]|jgi:hypothetical protein
MRASAGNIAYTVAVAVTAVLLAAAALVLALFVVSPAAASALHDLPDNAWWFLYAEAPHAGYAATLWRIVGAIAAAVMALGAAIRSRRLFRRLSSPLLPFLALFLFCLSFECLRAVTAWLYAADLSIEAAVILTRVIYWGRFVGLLGLLLGALYCADLKYKKYAVLTGVLLIVSFAMAAYIPIDRTIFLAQFTWKLGDEQGVWFVNLVISFLVVAASASSRLTRGDSRCLLITAGFALLLVARELLFFSLSPLLQGCGLLSLAAGEILCLRMIPRLGEPRTRRAS